ncbi:MAG TPA: IS200/IS605 family transposase [Flavobacterium sp.]|nr:IS200/IS605 family transposase [Flavobacterium sp.]
MPYIKIWIHLVWATKDRNPYLNDEIRGGVYSHMKEYSKTKGIYLDHVNGYVEHVHCLLSLDSNQNIATIVNLLKGESSFRINKNKLTKEKFGWQDEYFAASVSYSQLDMVRNYFRNQEEHHRKKTFHEEYEEFINKYDFLKG